MRFTKNVFCCWQFFKGRFYMFSYISWATDAICWQIGFFWHSYRLEELINKLLTKWNISQAFLIQYTLYLYLWWSLYLWWRVPRPICVFPKLSTLDEKSLRKMARSILRKPQKSRNPRKCFFISQTKKFTSHHKISPWC